MVLLEGLLQIFQPIEYRVRGDKIELPREKKYRFINDKTAKLDRVISTSWNSLGFRGEPPPQDFAGCLTIIAIGGSTTECTLVSDGKTWCDRLAAKLKERFYPVWLNNGGLNGHSTFGHLILMEDIIVKIKPKVALFLVGANDIDLAAPWKFDKNYLKKNPVRGVLASCWIGLINHSRILSYAVNFLRYRQAHTMGLIGPVLDFPHLKQVEISAEKEQASLREQAKFLKPYAQRLTRLIDLSRRAGIEPVFITQPTVFGDLIDPATGANLATADSWDRNGKVLSEILELYNETLRQTAAVHQVEVIDLAREMPNNTNFYYDTYHFTNAGCQEAAEIIDKHLEPWLAKKYPQYLLKNHATNY